MGSPLGPFLNNGFSLVTTHSSGNTYGFTNKFSFTDRSAASFRNFAWICSTPAALFILKPDRIFLTSFDTLNNWHSFLPSLNLPVQECLVVPLLNLLGVIGVFFNRLIATLD